MSSPTMVSETATCWNDEREPTFGTCELDMPSVPAFPVDLLDPPGLGKCEWGEAVKAMGLA